jgi:hypothetical protein
MGTRCPLLPCLGKAQPLSVLAIDVQQWAAAPRQGCCVRCRAASQADPCLADPGFTHVYANSGALRVLNEVLHEKTPSTCHAGVAYRSIFSSHGAISLLFLDLLQRSSR